MMHRRMKKQESQPGTWKFAVLAAHQMKSPIAAVKTILRTLLGGWAGPLTDKQMDLLTKADARCGQAIESIQRTLAIARAVEGGPTVSEVADIAVVARKVLLGHADEARRHEIALTSEIEIRSAHVRGHEPGLFEALNALLDNAIKYTPARGQIHVTLTGDPAGRTIRISVADSGIGIPPKDRERVFEPFFRTATAKGSARSGTGLGLALVKAVVESSGGSVRAAQAELGGAEIIVDVPACAPGEAVDHGDAKMTKAMKVVIVGGVAAGPKVAAKVIRLMPDSEVTVVEKNQFLSYAGCGLPYYISGVVKTHQELMATPVGIVRDLVFFQKVKNVRVMNQTEAVQIDRAGKRLRIRDVVDGRESWLDYDKLVLATGASPIVPPIPQVKLGNIFSLHGVHDAEGIKAALAKGKAHDVVIVGGGLIGVEVTEALVQRGCRVTIVEMLPQILGILDWEVAKLVEHHMESQGVRVLTETKAESFEGDDKVKVVVTDKGRLPADMVILAVGVRPNVGLARAAGLELGTTGAIKVDERMCTSDPDVYAAGDCVESIDLVTGHPCYFPLGSTANKQGRVAAVNLCGGHDRFGGVVGSTVCKVFDYCVGRTGLTEAAARELGYEVVTVLSPAPDKAHYMPNAKTLMLKLVVDRKTRRLLGAQATGPGAADKRIDVAAMAITGGMTVDQLANVDLCYAPPYSEAMDNIITACNIARNKFDGYMAGLSPMEVHRMLEEKRDFIFLDVRGPAEYEQVRLPHTTLIPLSSLRGRLDELPRDKPIVAFSEISLRGYEAALILRAAGFREVAVLDGGVDMWPYEKLR